MSRDNNRRPNYSGYDMSGVNINPNGLDEGGEETSRRIAFQPSFEPVTTFEPPSIGKSSGISGSELPRSSNTKAASAVALNTGFWQLRSIPTLPDFHPLERTAVFVPYATPADVSTRISEVLRERSIDSTYDDENAKVRCLTAEGVDFRIRLYRGRGRFSHGIIVEVQRRFGTSTVFHDDTMAILDAAEGKTPCPPPPSSNIPMVSDSEDDYQPCGQSSLKMVSKLLNHKGYDSYYLAFQTLQSLTDISKMGPTTACVVATELLLSNESDVGGKVLALVLDRDGDDELFKLRSMALTVIANSIQALNGKIHEMLWERLRPIFIHELRNAEKCPRNAVQAAKSIQYLLSNERNVSEIHSALQVAHQVGSVRHASLQRQTRVCLDQIN